MAENGGVAARSNTSRPRPTITLPPRENLFFDSTSFSPGPMTLVSSFFSDTGSQSFSQLLAGAMASPAPAATGSYSFGVDAKSKESEGGDKSLGFKQNRPVNLLIASSPLFMIPPGLSPSGFLNSPGFFSSHSQLQSPFGMSHQQALAQVTAQAAISQSSNNQSPPGYQPTSSEHAESFISNSSGTTNVTAEQQIPMDSRSPVIESSEVRGYDSIKSQSTSIAVDKPASDGYNWRKYGQKQVKGSVFPRSYYKCTQIGCPVKKKVERSIEGQIIEIIYKGQHNHELPRSNGKGKDWENSPMKENAQIKPEIEKHDSYSMDNKPAHLLMEGGHDSSTMTLELVQRHGSEEATVKVDSKEESQCTGDEPNPKRRKSMQPAPSQKTVTESRIVVQTRSEVDLLDDGFKWRKYGQKVVKGNPYPRSYYKCTTPGCSVRKHVERAAADPKAVITTYEGKHTHDIPLGKHSSSHASQSNPVKTAAQQTLPITN